ncbi:MAG TPA: hypothetical protein VFZ66_25295 [Herpetosiphonaceae bacterium]
MQQPKQTDATRRAFLRAALALPAALALAACARQIVSRDTPVAAVTPQPTSVPPTAATETQPTAAPTQAATETQPTQAAAAQTLQPTPSCADDDEITPGQTEGPYYTPNSPERTSLIEAGITGTPLVLTGTVLTTSCKPVARALIDFWHADDSGEYDNVGYRLRGHQFTDDQGRYRLETIMPGLYPGRTRHIHLKVQAPSQPILTTQLYFPDEPGNSSDGIFSPDLVVDVQESGGSTAATFDFVLDMA